MKDPTVRCSVCREMVFGKPSNTKKDVTCFQCRYSASASRKFRRVPRKIRNRNIFCSKPLNKSRPSV